MRWITVGPADQPGTSIFLEPPAADPGVTDVGFEAADQHIGLVPGGGPQGMTSPVAYRHVPDIEAKLTEVTAAGATTLSVVATPSMAHPRHRYMGGQCLGGWCAVPGAAVLRLGRRGAADGHADGQPDRQEPGRHPAVRLGLGHSRDVSMIEGEVEVLEIDALPQQRGDRFAARTGFDPRALATPYRWFRISPRRVQAWREVNELPDRDLMRDGRWLV